MNSIFYNVFKELANFSSGIIILLDNDDKIIFANKNSYHLLYVDTDINFIGHEISDIFKIDDHQNEKSECQIKTMINEAVIHGSITKHCNILFQNKQSVKVEVIIKVVEQGNENYRLIIIKDVSRENRDKILERLFFHDLMNSAGGLNGLAQLMNEGVEMTTDEISGMLNSLTSKLMKDIYEYRILYKAENGSLIPEIEKLNFNWIQGSVLKNIKDLKGMAELHIKLNFDSDCDFYSDPRILEQIFINMIKNAWKERIGDETILMNIKHNQDWIRFSVHNKKYIIKENRKLIFQKSLSQDVFASGLGTYMIKLYGEKYLNGKVGYLTDEKRGTEFFIEIPIKHPSYP